MSRDDAIEAGTCSILYFTWSTSSILSVTLGLKTWGSAFKLQSISFSSFPPSLTH
jgi:hypothetical protein